MFKENDVVVYNRSGVCVIEKIEEKSFLTNKKYDNTYYVLKPVFDPTSTIFVPVGNEKLVGMMRSVLSKKEIDEMIERAKNSETTWIDEQRVRTENFRRTLSGGINTELLQMIRCLLAHKDFQAKNGKKLCSSDEEMLRDAKREVSREFAYSLGIEQDDVENYIATRLAV